MEQGQGDRSRALELEVERRTEIIQGLEKENTDLRQDISWMRANLTDSMQALERDKPGTEIVKESRYKDITGELDKLRTKLTSRASAQATKGPGETESYDLKLSQIAKEKEELNKAYIALQEQYQAHPEVVSLRQQCQTLEAQAGHAQQLSAELQALQGQHQTMQTQQAEFVKLQELCQTLEAESVSAKEMQAEFVKLQAEDQALRQRCQELEDHCQAAESQRLGRSSSEAEVVKLQQQIRSLEGECAGMRGLEAEVVRLQQQCQGLEAELTNSRASAGEAQSWRQQCEVLTRQNEQHALNAEEVARLRIDSQTLENEKRDIEMKHTELKEEYDGLKVAAAQGSGQDSEVLRLERKCQQLESSSTALQADVFRLQEERRTLQASINKTPELEAEVERLTSRCQALEAVEHQRATPKGGVPSILPMPSSPTSLLNSTGSFLTKTSYGSIPAQHAHSARFVSGGGTTHTMIPAPQPGSVQILRPSFVPAAPTPQSPIPVPMITVASQVRPAMSSTPAVGAAGFQSTFQPRSTFQTTVLQR